MALTIGRYDRIKFKGRKNGARQIECRIAEDKVAEAVKAGACSGWKFRRHFTRRMFEGMS
jgi:hypothetical protein